MADIAKRGNWVARLLEIFQLSELLREGRREVNSDAEGIAFLLEWKNKMKWKKEKGRRGKWQVVAIAAVATAVVAIEEEGMEKGKKARTKKIEGFLNKY